MIFQPKKWKHMKGIQHECEKTDSRLFSGTRCSGKPPRCYIPYALTLLQIHEIHGILKKGEFLWIQMI